MTYSKKNLFILIAAVLIMLFIIWLPISASTGLTVKGKTALGILAFAIILWMTEAIPFPVTGLSLVLFIPLFGLAPFKEAITLGFGNSIIVFFIGIMTMSAALTRSGFTYRLTLIILHKIGFDTSRLLLVFLAIGAFFSMWVTNMGVAAILLPIAVEMLENSGREPLKSNFGKGLMIAIAWGCGIGGMGTPVGNGANVLAIGFLQDMAGLNITFIDWMKVGVPAILFLLPLSWLILKKVFPPEVKTLPIDKKYVEEELTQLGELTNKERNTLILFGIAIFFWLTNPLLETYFNLSIPIQAVAVFVAVAMFLPTIEVLKWEEAEEIVNWGAIVLIAGGLSLGNILYQTGAVGWLAQTFMQNIGNMNLVLRFIAIVAIVQFLKIFFSSNTATGLVITPIMIALAQGMGLNVWLVAGPAALAISLAFILVPSSPTNVIPYSAGYFTMRDFLVSGIWLSLTGVLTISLAFILFGGL